MPETKMYARDYCRQHNLIGNLDNHQGADFDEDVICHYT